MALLPLIFGNLQINRLVLRDADILIENDAKGRSNLDFTGDEKTEKASEGTFNLPQINNVLIENAVLTLIDGARGTTTKLKIIRLAAKAENLSAPLAIDLSGVVTLEGQADPLDHDRLLAREERDGLSPAGRNVSCDEAVDEGPGNGTAAMRNEVDLQESGLRFVPVSERPDRDLLSDSLHGLAPPASSGLSSDRCEQTIEGRGTRREQSLANLRVEFQVTVTFHGLNEVGQDRLQPLAADSIGGFPRYDQGLADCFVVDPHAGRLLLVS